MSAAEPVKRPRGRPRDPDVRSRVLSEAARQLVAGGFDAMTMEGVLTAAGVAKRTLYKWWPTKTALVSDALLSGFIDLPVHEVPATADVWADLESWLRRAGEAMLGPYGEVMRTAVAISATDPAIAVTLNDRFSLPVRAELIRRIDQGVADGQISAARDCEALVDVILSLLIFVGVTRAPFDRYTEIVAVLRRGVDLSGPRSR